ncbi:class II fructose-bisphosphate aldolase [Paenibacillus alvei]|uniref:Tagatose-bisphosphate aldolase n=1 Tax=Paenibacillus alvei TaxID=44250 RepID=A0A383RKU5_PAEAL|nr:class II fructose-bisphosphate aldolase [Paenibacillus alvei]SYX81593.1 Tagatose-bisphosphate aldolase [Paenibacillus alvei]SYX87648.1 Tagatose-bisphosphate aldolase [Paenibacillus alvei]
MLVTLTEMMQGLPERNAAVPAFNVFGYEDASAVIAAAEEVGAPVILASNKVALRYMPLQVSGALYRSLAERAKVPVCIHLDHGDGFESAAEAIMSGYTSIMYDGSQLPLADNIRNTREIVKLAHACGIPVEAEIGAVGYMDPSMNVEARLTAPGEAKVFAEETGVDALAVAIGTLHRMEEQSAPIDYERLAEIERVVSVPLVLHGSTGVKDDDLRRLAATRISKVNIGTALRMAFGKTLRSEILDKPNEFDRITLFARPMEAVKEAAKQKMLLLNAHQALNV